MSCAKSTLKVVLFVSNVIGAIFGLITAAICAIALSSLHNWHFTYGVIGIVAGTLAFLISLCGCCGIKRESTGCMWTYVIMLTILIATQFGIMLSFHSRDMVKITTDMVEQLWSEEVQQPGPMASMEQTYKCCGLNGYEDYPAAGLIVPDSCYENGHNGDLNRVFMFGCFEKMSRVSAHIARCIKTVFWIFTGIEGTTAMLAIILAYSFRDHRRSGYTPY